MFCEPAAPALKAVSIAYVPKNRICLPYSSDMGAHSSGPIAKPRTKRDIPKVATSVPMSKVARTCLMPPE